MTLMPVATSALNVKVVRKQARVDGRRNHDSASVDVAVWLESTMNRVSDGDRFTSLSFLSCGALQSNEIIGILKVFFRCVGIGTQLAFTSMDWMNIREAVVLVPNLIVSPPQVTDCVGDSHFNFYHEMTFHNVSFDFLNQVATGKPCVICQDTSHNVVHPSSGRAVVDRQERCVPATDRKLVT